MAAELAAEASEDPVTAARTALPQGLTYLRAPLYTTADATKAIGLLHGIEYGVETEVAPGIAATYVDAGHILGSAIIRLRVREGDRERTIVFSGDLGRPGTPIIRDPTPTGGADFQSTDSMFAYHFGAFPGSPA